MTRFFVSLGISASAVLFFLIPEVGLSNALAKGKTKPRGLYSFSTVRPYLAHAHQDCQCHYISDSFDKRDCKRSCKTFKRKMIAWAKKNSLIHQNLELSVDQYNFKRKSFRLTASSQVMPDVYFQRVDQDGVFIGKHSCDRIGGQLSGMVNIELSLRAKMKENAAKTSILRTSESVNAIAVLKPKSVSVNWCCTSYTKRLFRRDKAKCSTKGTRYSVQDILVGGTVEEGIAGGLPPDVEETEDGVEDTPKPWKKGFKKPVKVLEFTPEVIGVSDVPGSME